MRLMLIFKNKLVHKENLNKFWIQILSHFSKFYRQNAIFDVYKNVHKLFFNNVDL